MQNEFHVLMTKSLLAAVRFDRRYYLLDPSVSTFSLTDTAELYQAFANSFSALLMGQAKTVKELP